MKHKIEDIVCVRSSLEDVWFRSTSNHQPFQKCKNVGCGFQKKYCLLNDEIYMYV